MRGTMLVAAVLVACGGETVDVDVSSVPLGTSGGMAAGTVGSPDASPAGPVAPPCVEGSSEVCDGWDNDCNGETDDGFVLRCRPCDDAGCTQATLAGGGWKVGVARNLAVGSDRGIALPPLPAPSEYLYVSNSSEDTVSQVRIADGVETARYLVGDNPSRTAVDGKGDAWVAMRGNISGDESKEPVMKLRGDCVPAIKPPNPTHECVALHVPEVGRLLRGVAIDARGDAWIGSYQDMEVILLDGETGAQRERILLDPPSSVYGLAVDPDGFLWVAAREGGAAVLRVDPARGEVDLALTSAEIGDMLPYGIAADGAGGIWFGSYSTSIFRVDAKTGAFGPKHLTGGQTRGVAVDDDGAVWTADSLHDLAIRVDAETGEILTEVQVGSGPVGVSVDPEGNIWTANIFGDSLTRLTPEGDIIGDYPVGNDPYTYSDMTGAAFRVFRVLTGRFTAHFDTGVAGARWQELLLEGAFDAPATVTVRARAAEQDTALDAAAWSEVVLQGPTGPLGVTGRWLELEVTLTSEQSGQHVYVERLHAMFEEGE